MKRKYGWKPDKPDHRDKVYKRKVSKLPLKVDLRKRTSPVEDQGSLGSCTGNASVGALEYNLRKNKSKLNLSRLFIYYQARVLEGTVDEDSGAEIRDCIKSLAKVGVCKESLYKYDISKFTKAPTLKASKDAHTRVISSYERLNTLNDVLGALADGNPVIFGFSVYESFESYEVAETGIMPYPSIYERMLGGHAVLAVGYDMSKQMILVRNSWGTDWGIKGHFWMPFKVISNRYMSDDFWIIRK